MHRLRALLAWLGVLALACLATPALAATPPVLADVRVGACSGATVPEGFLGLSVEWSMVERWAGVGLTRAERARLPLVEVLRSLRTRSGSGGVLRIGGDSQDGYVWSSVAPTAANRLFQGVVSPQMVSAVLDVGRLSGWKVVLGVNLRTGVTPVALSMARYAAEHDPGHVLAALEVGNEPDAYQPGVATYLQVFDLFARTLALDPLTRSVPLWGPALSNGGDLSWVRSLRLAQGARLSEVTWHHYANRPTLGSLFDPSVSAHWRARIAESRRQAGRVPVRVEESNSVGTGGLQGVSDVTGSTAWLVDTVLTGASLGLAGYGLHTWDGADYPLERRTAWYTPFVVRDGKASPRPGFYALALLRDLPGRTFCGVQSALAPGQQVRTWAVARPAAGALSVVVVDQAGPGHAGRVRVAVPAGYAPTARVSRLTDPGGCSGRSARISGAVLPATGTFREGAGVARAVDGKVLLDLHPCETVRLDLVRAAPRL
ncbi:MAG: putative lipoprotein [Frankiales bacterium]|nr:putative lipoprotein [Frankiales bacterium]